MARSRCRFQTVIAQWHILTIAGSLRTLRFQANAIRELPRWEHKKNNQDPKPDDIPRYGTPEVVNVSPTGWTR